MDTYKVTYEVTGRGPVTSETSFAVGDYEPGQQMEVEYDAEAPTTVGEVGARDGVWLLYGGFGVAGLVLLGRCGWLVRRARQR